MFKFVSDNVGGVGTKRKHAGKSCDSCKKRHKRCSHLQTMTSDQRPGAQPLPPGPHGTAQSNVHVVSNDEPRDSASVALPSDTARATAQPKGLPKKPPPASQTSASETAYLRFVGDLSPEASFLANRGREAGTQRPSRQGEVGVWLEKPDDQAPTDDQQQDSDVLVEPVGSPAFRLGGLAGLKSLYPYLRRECMSILPPEYEFGLLSRLYYAKFDPLFPILHEEAIDQHDPMDAVALKQCICLQAALDPSMRPHLKLSHSADAVLSQLDFRTGIATALKQSLDMGFIRDKMVLLQVSVLMAFYTDKPSSSEISTFYAAQSVQLSHTLGLHLGWPGDSSSTKKSRRIFWCVWTLDRLNAAANGRPITIHQQDMNKRILEAVPEQIPSFRLFIGISQFLDAVISQYRPHATPDSRALTEEFHSFEVLAQDANALEVGSALLASLELFHLSVFILQSRPRKSNDTSQRVPSSTLQSFSATSIVCIASEDFRLSMTFWAVVPYAVSMATSIAYQDLRNSSIPYKRKRAYTTFHSSCDILDELSKAFLSARTMAKLAKDTLQEVERVSVNRNRANKLSDSSRHSAAGDEEASGLGMTRTSQGTSEPCSREASRSVQTQMTSGETQSFPAVGDGIVSLGQSTVDTAQTPIDLNPFDSMDFTDVAGIFDDFDPSFHLNRIDALFSANLDPTMPFAPDEWLDDGYLEGCP